MHTKMSAPRQALSKREPFYIILWGIVLWGGPQNQTGRTLSQEQNLNRIPEDTVASTLGTGTQLSLQRRAGSSKEASELRVQISLPRHCPLSSLCSESSLKTLYMNGKSQRIPGPEVPRKAWKAVPELSLERQGS